MSFTIISNEDIRICNTNNETRAVATALKQYIFQCGYQICASDMDANISLTVDGKTASVKIKPYSLADPISLDTLIEISLKNETDIEHDIPSPWKDDPEFESLVNKIEKANDISARISLCTMQYLGGAYSITYWDSVFENGPVEGVTCRIMWRTMDDGIAYSCVGLSGDIVGEIPYDTRFEDVSDITRWSVDDILLSIAPLKEDKKLDVDVLNQYIEKLDEFYEVELIELDEDVFTINGSACFSVEEFNRFISLLKSINQYSKDNDLCFFANAYFYASDNSFSLAHVYTSDNGEIQIDCLKI